MGDGVSTGWTRRILAAGAFAGALSWCGQAWAIDPDLFGHYNQNATEFAGICGGNSCGPIATLNSLVYLQKKYPKIYGTKLVGDDPVETAKALAKAMGCTECGAGTDGFYKGKVAYFEANAPGTTRVKRKQNPTAAFLNREIKGDEDVEILISYYNADGEWSGEGHYVTLYDLDDTHLLFIDPGGVDGADGGKIDGATREKVAFSFNGTFKQIVLTGYDGTPAGMTARVDFAFSESPIPEPATWAILVLGFGLGGAVVRRRRYRSFAVDSRCFP